MEDYKIALNKFILVNNFSDFIKKEDDGKIILVINDDKYIYNNIVIIFDGTDFNCNIEEITIYDIYNGAVLFDKIGKGI